ncbi:MAG TPA: serine hydrolase domain-containing protein [Hyphomicrobiales bacterium]|nr:serine hydrolase domain-containing protein [Hyphomicrobiales bacterium]
MIEIGDYPNIIAIHGIRNNRRIIEQFRDGTDEAGIFPVGCVFKSFVSVLMGIAIYEGKISSIEDSVLDYIPHGEIPDIRWHKVKIRHALSKTTGIVWPGPQEHLPDSMDGVLRLSFEDEPGAAFRYKPDPQIIVYLLEKVYGMDIIKLFERKLLAHFKHTGYCWNRDDIEDMRVCIGMLDELGQLLLHKGVLNGQTVFSEMYYRQCLCAYSAGGFPEHTAYGLGWWVDAYQGVPYFYAAGFGGQKVLVCPEHALCISLLSDMDRPHPENKRAVEQILDTMLEEDRA